MEFCTIAGKRFAYQWGVVQNWRMIEDLYDAGINVDEAKVFSEHVGYGLARPGNPFENDTDGTLFLTYVATDGSGERLGKPYILPVNDPESLKP